MTMTKLASRIAKLEGKKSQARIGDIREILAILSDIMAEERGVSIALVLYDNGFRRQLKGKKR